MARRYASLVGIDGQKLRLEKGLRVLLDPTGLQRWSETHYRSRPSVLDYLQRRPPLFVLAGDVGTGKTALAETVGDAVARSEKLDVTLHRLSLASRGSGLVGEMTRLVATAFERFGEEASKIKSKNGGKARAGAILLIDEADALAQSRETAQMHHEDRAGVNALIRGIDSLAALSSPAAVVMCTNRISAIDPAVRRRAADVIEFRRPAEAQRAVILKDGLEGLGFSAEQIEQLAKVNGAHDGGADFTYADLTDRFLPNLVLHCYPDQKITYEAALTILRDLRATPAFNESGN